MAFFSSLKSDLQAVWGYLENKVSYIVTELKVVFTIPNLNENVKITAYDTLTHLPSNLMQVSRGFLQIVHAPSAILKSLESPRIRQANMTFLREIPPYLAKVFLATQFVRFMPFISEDIQTVLLFCALTPVKTRLLVNNIFHSANITKTFSEEIPNNKNLVSCEDGKGAQASADVESVFRYMSELIFAAMMYRIPIIGPLIGFLLEALANAQYLIELKLGVVGMCSTHRREVFVNNSMYAIGFSLSFLLSVSWVTEELKNISGFKSPYMDTAVLLTFTNLFSMVSFLQHGPFPKQNKGKDLLSRDFFFFNHTMMDFLLRESVDLLIPRLHDPEYRKRQATNIKNLIYYIKIPVAILTGTDLYSIERWDRIPALKLFLQLSEKDISRFLNPIGKVKNEMNKLPDWLVHKLPEMSNILAYAIYFLWKIKISNERLEMILSFLNNPSINQTIIRVKYLLRKLNPSEDILSEIESVTLVQPQVILVKLFETKRLTLHETADGQFEGEEHSQVFEEIIPTDRFQECQPNVVENADGSFQQMNPTRMFVANLSGAETSKEWFLHQRQSVCGDENEVSLALSTSPLRRRSLFPEKNQDGASSHVVQSQQSSSRMQNGH